MNPYLQVKYTFKIFHELAMKLLGFSGGTSIRIWGTGKEKTFKGQKVKKMCMKHAKYFFYFCHFYAEIVKFSLILTHLLLFWGANGEGVRTYFGGNAPCPL